MKLKYKIIAKLTATLTVLLTIWAIFFYMAMIEEINDEVDDALDSYAETLIIRKLAGQDMPTTSDGSNNQYYITEVTEEYAKSKPIIIYKDSIAYMEEKKETEPARVLITIFPDENNTYHQLTVLTPTIEKEDLRLSIAKWIILLYAAMLIVIIIVNIIVFQKNIRPLYILLKWIEDYKTGGKNRPLDNPTNVTEFRKLNAAASEFANRHEKQFEEQKMIIGNASHEMQTPLAICINRIELLMDDENLTEKQMEELFKTKQTLEHLTKLNKSLLLLSKIENKQFTDTVQLNLDELILKYLGDYKAVYKSRNITTECRMESHFTVNIHETLAVMLMTNLLKNSYAHNRPDGHITIEADKSHITIANTSDSDGALDAEHIFEKFYQGSKREGSTGLGLAICDSICKISGLSLTYAYRHGMHCFTIERKK